MPKNSDLKKRSRQPDHEGTPQRLPSGKTRYIGTVTGRRICGPANDTAREAKAAFKLKVHEILAPEAPRTPADPSFQDFVYDLLEGPFLERRNQELLAPKTWDLHEQIFRINIRNSELGKKPLSKIVPADVERWASRLATQQRTTQNGRKVFPSKPLSPSSKRRYLGAVQAFLEYAVKNEKLIPTNPAVDVPKPSEGESTSRALSDEEVSELLELCGHEPPENGGEWRNRRRLLVVLLGLHGFGPAEICGLRYEDFDGTSFLPCRQNQIWRNKIVHRTRLKTKARHARVPARRAILEILDLEGDGWIVSTETGGPTEPGNIRKIFSRMVAGTKFERVTPYDLRHTFANELLRNGVDVKTAADLMRHSVAMFLRRYLHGDESSKAKAIASLKF